MESKKQRVAVVGAGLVGSLQACVLAKRGYEVHLYEYRQDIRLMEHVPGRSINLALSVRGLSGLSLVGLDDHMKKKLWNSHDQAILSIGRRYLNEILITEGENYPNLHRYFEHKLIECDPKTAKLKFEHEGKIVDVDVDFVIGCDGAFSSVRKAIMKSTVFNYEQHYIPHAYKELCVPPTKDGQFAMDSNFLHIWPRNQFMMIALPNQDKSFTVTLFMPFEKFNSLQIIFSTKDSPLISIKCSPYNYQDKVLILGDAAHAMVPFYGQGMNCGLEDVTTLDSFFDKYPDDLKKVFEEFSKFRSIDAQAMCDLAMYNYVEMRDLVTKKGFLIRKFFDDILHWFMPSFWVPLYTSVTFSRMRYHECIKNKKWQDNCVANFGSFILKGLFVGALFLGYEQRQSLALFVNKSVDHFDGSRGQVWIMMETRPTRRSFSREFKLKVVKYFYEHQHNNLVTANHFNINRKQVRCWVRDEWKFHEHLSQSRSIPNPTPSSSSIIHCSSSPKKLVSLSRGNEILKELEPGNDSYQQLSSNWFINFKKRFHIYFKKDPDYTKLLPPSEGDIALLNNIPLSFLPPSEKASVQLTVFLDGISRVRPLLLFSAQDPPIVMEERDSYDPRTRVMFQQFAETDEEILKEWIDSEWESSMDFFSGSKKVIFSDLPHSRLTRSAKQSLKSSYSYLKEVPEGCISSLFIFNEIIRKPFLIKMKQAYSIRSAEGSSSSLKDREERVYLSKCIGDVWESVSSDAEEIKKSFSKYTVLLHLGTSMGRKKEEWDPADLVSSLDLEDEVDEDGEGEYFIDCDPV
ncbi:KMO [Lepeophtheirus salmonis]|uniref:KMO n=1 Tax=Lepeophtheirus salmonis TaxID=72036 RepID=A0A7R8CPZ8_LEPSM|nr:KMO [Lepeophtheirus salmonis]CAF2843862.1 KMO [Lepeophtheirus salmonis]